MHTNPLISVIIPAYNVEKTLGVAVESILNQTYKNLDIIIVDDGSADATLAVAESYAKRDPRVRVVAGPKDPERFDPQLNRNINAGFAAKNLGFKHVRGEYIAIQDADDASLLNRIEIQYQLLTKYNATLITTGNREYDDALVGTYYEGDIPPPAMGPEELYKLAKKTKGIIPALFPALNRKIPFRFKRMRVINKLFFGSLQSYPGAAGVAFFRRDIIDRIQFRPLKNRVWPSFMGRGGDRDFNFQVAETFKNSYFVPVPVYLWRSIR